MSYFKYRAGVLFVEDLSLEQIANEYSSPCYVYSKQAIIHNWTSYNNAVAKLIPKARIFYAVKANSNVNILSLLANLGAGFDVVSGGELARVLRAGGKSENIVFSGVGKSIQEIKQAIDTNIYSLNIESKAELIRTQEIAKAKSKIVNIAIRINPDITSNSHPYISTGSKENKFGIDYTQALDIYMLAAKLPNINVQGISCHIGSQIITVEPFISAIEQILHIADLLKINKINLKYINIGGGLGVRYNLEKPPTIEEYTAAIATKLQDPNLEIHFEPGRSIIADAGIMLTKIEYLKTTGENNFAIADAGMNDLIRPALYQSYHEVIPVRPRCQRPPKLYNIVGPLCESGDFLAKDRSLDLEENDLLAIKTCGAYGFSMSSNYNTRPRCAEVLVDGTQAYLIRRRETIEQLMQNEL